MKKCLTTLAVAGLPGAALAHPGHPEMAGPDGHLIAHFVIGMAIATVAGIVIKVAFRKEG